MPGEGLLIVGLLIAGAPCSPPARIRTVRTYAYSDGYAYPSPHYPPGHRYYAPELVYPPPHGYAPNRGYYGTFYGFTPTRSYSGNSGPQITFTFPSSGYP